MTRISFTLAASLTAVIFVSIASAQGGIVLKDSGLGGNPTRGGGGDSSIGGGIYGIGPRNSNHSSRVHTGRVPSTSIMPNRTAGNGRTIVKSQNRSNGSLMIAASYTVRKWNPHFYNQSVRQAQARISQVDRVVDQLNAQYQQNPTEQNRQALIGWLNRLRDEKNRFANDKRIWNTPLNVQFNNDSVQQKQKLVERALQLGFAGKTIQFGSNKDGSKRVILWDGKPNYSRSQNVSHLF